MSAAQEHKVVDAGRAAVGAGHQVVDVAERGWSGAALGDAAAVAGGDGAALGGGDGVRDGGEADDLTVVVDHDALDPAVAQQRVDPAAGGRSAPRCGGA